jgi:hypothetical protein
MAFCSSTNLNVYTEPGAGITGRVTIATAPERSILPVGNIVTNDYDVTTGIPVGSNNMIGLVPGKHVRFNASWSKQFVGDAAATNKRVTDLVTQEPGDPNGNGTLGTLHISAGIIAVGTAHLVIGGTNYTEQGTEYWDIGPPTPGHTTRATPTDYTYVSLYNYKLFGNHVLGGYRAQALGSTANNNVGCTGTITTGKQTFVGDSRMSELNQEPPGFPTLNTVGGLLVLRMKGWLEENKYL